MNNRKQILEAQLTKIAGVQVEITVRGEKAFTFSWDGQDNGAAEKIKAFFGFQMKFESFDNDPLYDEECDMCCMYATARMH